MKDPLGHGSDGKGAFKRVAQHQIKVERHVAFVGRTAAGQKITNTGNVWKKVGGSRRRAVAEKLAMFERIDNPNSRIRIR